MAEKATVDVVLRGRQEGMENLAKAGVSVFLLKEGFSQAATMVKRFNPALGEALEQMGRTLGLMKSMKAVYGTGGMILGGAFSVASMALDGMAQSQANARKRSDEHVATMAKLVAKFRELQDIGNPFSKFTAGTDAAVAATKAELEAIQKRRTAVTNMEAIQAQGGFYGTGLQALMSVFPGIDAPKTRAALQAENEKRQAEELDQARKNAALAMANFQARMNKEAVETLLDYELSAEQKKLRAAGQTHAEQLARIKAAGLAEREEAALTAREKARFEAELSRVAAERAKQLSVSPQISRFLSGAATAENRMERLTADQLAETKKMAKDLARLTETMSRPPVPVTMN